MTQEESVSHWQERARSELKAAQTLYEKGEADLYAEVLFHCHLAVELALKAEYIRERNCPAPFLHDLSAIASQLKNRLTDLDYDELDQLSEYAILARYGDRDWLTRHATKENACMWLEKTSQLLSQILP